MMKKTMSTKKVNAFVMKLMDNCWIMPLNKLYIIIHRIDRRRRRRDKTYLMKNSSYTKLETFGYSQGMTKPKL